jgi:hypothetical protein
MNLDRVHELAVIRGLTVAASAEPDPDDTPTVRYIELYRNHARATISDDESNPVTLEVLNELTPVQVSQVLADLYYLNKTCAELLEAALDDVSFSNERERLFYVIAKELVATYPGGKRELLSNLDLALD